MEGGERDLELPAYVVVAYCIITIVEPFQSPSVTETFPSPSSGLGMVGADGDSIKIRGGRD